MGIAHNHLEYCVFHSQPSVSGWNRSVCGLQSLLELDASIYNSLRDTVAMERSSVNKQIHSM